MIRPANPREISKRIAAERSSSRRLRSRRSGDAPARGIGYIRVSTDQPESGLEAQEAAVRGAAARLRLTLLAVRIDADVSGKLGIEDRPVLLDVVAALRRGDGLLVARRDRLGRDVIAVVMIERRPSRRPPSSRCGARRTAHVLQPLSRGPCVFGRTAHKPFVSPGL